MTETPFYKLKKPGENDYADINVLNENMDVLDQALHRLSTVYAAGETPPEDTRLLWVDTGSGCVIKFYDGSGWVAVKTAWA